MTAQLMIAIGLLACASAVALSYMSGRRRWLPCVDPLRSSLGLRALVAAFGIDLFLQLWQIDGARQPLWGAILDAAATGSIFWLLSFYNGALSGAVKVPTIVSALAAAQIGLGIARACIRSMPPYGAAATHIQALGVAWVLVSLALAVGVATFAFRRRNKIRRTVDRRRSSSVVWPELIAFWTYAIAGIVIVRTCFGPFLMRWPRLVSALDSPLVDTLLIVVFVTLGAATGGLARFEEPLGPSSKIDDEAAERRARLLVRADAILDKTFADPNLTMPRLAAAVGCSEHQLSAALNQGRGVNFFAYLNARRIREAMVLMQSGGITTTDIAFACGYNSRSTFYSAFRSITGQSPGEWRIDGKRSDSMS